MGGREEGLNVGQRRGEGEGWERVGGVGEEEGLESGSRERVKGGRQRRGEGQRGEGKCVFVGGWGWLVKGVRESG